ncbi:uncharacterized protein LOC131246346 [Magnolia sinica]|uniref:uncharacterized protein LOC131246346 n=1 Tax=Magnolia sinica TaxID=86752 RepID=UPI00265A6448|nr:uncharacterized protein LOC131246346 [Magnolia sinica]XP_058102355.1 uncharacterized protein LOC131246346 [Magnolia sinica]XP_058102357.1 uncharacterized protein LOC131246346 [Magnolia sinica]XP_058102358.1 uncharacterized protein LOC131246346 [Magnolia sinica]XP_058102359.1 uncharacterized protein LOC131246346 [Magnolia sinica]
MASTILSHLQNLWPFSLRKTGDDLKLSDTLVRGLPIPDQTKQFVFAIREPESQAVVYVLAAQNLSEQSALDAEYLIKVVRPDAVVAQISPSALIEIQQEENHLRNDEEIPVPTSAFGVLKGCFVDKINSVQYESLAGGQVLREIFGIGFYGHFLAAKSAAKEADSTFLSLESPFVSTCVDNSQDSDNNDLGNAGSGLLLQPSNLLPGKVTSVISSNSKRFCLTDKLQSQMVKSLSSSLALSTSKDLKPSFLDSVHGSEAGDCQPRCDFQAPSFAESVYSLLTDLHDMFIDIPAIGKALVYAQKILVDVDEGKSIDTKLLSEVHNFRIAVEGLRIALNSAARSPVNKMEKTNSAAVEFSDLPPDEKCHVLFAQALKSQTKKFRSIVAIVDASSLAGLRKHWNTTVPLEVAELADQCFRMYDSEVEISAENTDRKRLLADKPVVAVGAGATAVLGASSLSKAVPVSTLVKVVTYKVPVSLKIGLAQMQRTAAIALTKILGPSKIVAPGIASSGAKTSALKVTASAEKIRVVAHSIIASAERTSFQAMRSAFYEIMRRRQGRPVGVMPWTAFGCSVATCTGLLVYGDGIECVAESVPSAPTIACLGRGLRSLHQASQEARQTNTAKIHEAIKSLMYSLKK